MKKRKLISLFSLLCVLTSCGGYEKSSTLSVSTLNRDARFSIRVPVYKWQSINISFYFQDGYTVTDLKHALDEKNDVYFEYGDEIFISTIVNNKTEYFLIIPRDDKMDGKQLYYIESTSENFVRKSGLMIGWVLLPYFLLEDKNQYNDIKEFFGYEKMESLLVSINCNYQYAKLIYSQSAQKEITFDDENQSFTIYQSVTFSFSENTLTMSRVG